MKIFLIVALVIIGIFVFIFIAGIIFAVILGSKNKRHAYAVIKVSKLPEELRGALKKIFLYYKKDNSEEVNNIVSRISQEGIKTILDIIPKNRPANFSAGKFGDNLSWTAWKSTLTDKGYSNDASEIIAGIFFHDLDRILSDINGEN